MVKVTHKKLLIEGTDEMLILENALGHYEGSLLEMDRRLIDTMLSADMFSYKHKPGSQPYCSPSELQNIKDVIDNINKTFAQNSPYHKAVKNLISKVEALRRDADKVEILKLPRRKDLFKRVENGNHKRSKRTV